MHLLSVSCSVLMYGISYFFFYAGKVKISRPSLQPMRNFFTLNRQLFLESAAVGLGGLGVTCSPQDPRFASSNPTEIDGFFQDEKILSTSPPGGTLSWGVSSLRFQARQRTLSLKK